MADVTSSALGDGIALSRHRTTDGDAAYRDAVGSAVVPAHGSLTMSPHGVDVTVRAEAGWLAGDLVPFTLHFQRSGRINVVAIVIRPGEGSL